MADARRWLTVSLGVGMVLGMMDACLILDSEHCKTDGDCGAGLVCDPCVAASPGIDGCVAAADRMDTDLDTEKCQAAEDSGTSGNTTEGTETTVTTTEPMSTDTVVDPDTTATEGGTETDSTTGPAPMCDDADGTFGDDCPGDSTTPFCVGEVCVGCDNDILQTNCANAEGALGPVCTENGRCVVCTTEDTSACPAETPACDPETNACVPCSEHAQCGEAACNLFNGECVGPMVVNVVPGAMALANAVTAVSGAGGGTIVLADGVYDEPIFVGSGVVAFLAAPGASPEWRRSTGMVAPQLRVATGATVLVDGIEFRVNTSGSDPALRVDAANSRLWVDRSTIAQNFGVGIRAEAFAELVLRNCFVGGDSNIDVLDITTSATARVLYSTLAADTGSSNAVSCDGSTMDMVTVSDSILIARDSTAEVACTEIVADHTATNTMVLPGEGNMTVMATDDVLWFVDYNAGDFRLLTDGQTAFADIAEWNVDDPTVDIDGMPRSGIEGTPEHAGADVP